MNCIFCNIDTSKIENTIIEETNNFLILPSIGSLVDGYLLIVSKRHVNSMANLSENEKKEYEFLINKYRNLFKKIYNKSPIIFEHGSPILNSNMKASSVIHAHSHIVNHNFIDENSIIKKLKFKEMNNLKFLSKDKNYIMYINSENKYYITNDFKPISQILRKIIAKDLGYENMFDWKEYKFLENIYSTIKKVK